jgi:uncharacterized RDD family membrane protein YckC
MTAEPAPAHRADRDILTPEGVRLTVRIADLGDRLTALILDIAVFGVTAFALTVLIGLLVGFGGGVVLFAFGLVAVFLLRLLYFPLLELHWGGRTLGKKALGLRVIGRNGAPIGAHAVLTRNLVREVEVWLPVSVLLAAPVGGLGTWLLVGWVLCMCLLPALNRDRMRGGDLLAGTWVIKEPKPILEQDLLAGSAPGLPDAGPPADEAHFTAQQLDAYGERELNVLAELLIGYDRMVDAGPKAQAAARSIRGKIGYDGPPADDRAFLAAYYRAARAKMERDAQWGRLKADKHDPRRKPARRSD